MIPVNIDNCEIPKNKINGISFTQYQCLSCLNGNFFELMKYVCDLEGVHFEASPKLKVHVDNPIEFLSAIRSNTEIVVRKSFSLTGITIPDNEHVYTREVFDGEEVVLRGVENLYISGIDEPEITVTPRYATTLSIEKSNGVSISGITIGHSHDIGECQGAVLNFFDCSAIHVKDCRIFGCGTYGFQLKNCEVVTIEDCDVFECYYGFFTCESVSALRVVRTEFYDSFCFNAVEAKNSAISFNKCSVANNRARASNSRIFNTYEAKINFSETTIDIGGFDGLGLSSDHEGLHVTCEGAKWSIE